MIVTCCVNANTSSSRCVMNKIAAPRSRSVRTIVNSRSTSGSDNAAVGSSMISTFAFSDSALAISITC
jgi:hypothetical protein